MNKIELHKFSLQNTHGVKNTIHCIYVYII